MGDLVDELLKRHVTPVLREAGFRRSGANYRLVAENGDVAIVDVTRWTPDPAVDGFLMNLSVAPLPYVEWLNRDRPERMARSRGRQHALLQWSLAAPPEWQLVPAAMNTVWALAGDSDVDAVGEVLRPMLADAAPWLVSLFDREKLCATIQERYADFTVPLGRHVAQAVLRSAGGPADEVERLLAAALLPVMHALRTWITARLPRAASPERPQHPGAD
jgi:hypothetical protein